MLTFKHYSIAVHDLDDAVAKHQERFGMVPVGPRGENKVGNFDVQPMGYGDHAVIHLISPRSEEGPVARLMKERGNAFNPHGEGIYLMAYETGDVDAFAAQVEAGGGRVTRAPGNPNVWVHPTASNFVLMEIMPAK